MRYHRQSILPEVGSVGQNKIERARVLCVGVGGLGSPAALYLAGAGVGTLGLIDGDAVSLSNLHRQILYATAEVGTSKVMAASARLTSLNPGINIKTHAEDLSAKNALEIFSGYDLVVEGSDRFATKMLVNDVCVKLNLPWVYASVSQWEGQTAIFNPRAEASACYRCLQPKLPEVPIQNCAESGAMGPVVGMLGCEQALQALQVILGIDHGKSGILRIFDGQSLAWMNIAIQKNPNCAVCSQTRDQIHIRDEDESLSPLTESIPQKTAAQLKALLSEGSPPFTLIDVREQTEWDGFHIVGAVHWPLARLTSQRLPTLAKDHELVVYCQSGQRSKTAVAILKNAGFTRVFELKAGLSEWI